MACGTGFCAAKLIAGLVAVGVGGFAAYNYSTTGCVLGGCSTDSAAVAPVSAEGDDCCPLSGAEMVEVAAGEACGTACTDEMKAACEAAGKECGAGSCSEGMTEVAGKSDCQSACSGTAACPSTANVLEAATTTECEAKTECSEKTECAESCDKVAEKATEKSDG